MEKTTLKIAPNPYTPKPLVRNPNTDLRRPTVHVINPADLPKKPETERTS